MTVVSTGLAKLLYLQGKNFLKGTDFRFQSFVLSFTTVEKLTVRSDKSSFILCAPCLSVLLKSLLNGDRTFVFVIDRTFDYLKMRINSWCLKVKLLLIEQLYSISMTKIKEQK